MRVYDDDLVQFAGKGDTSLNNIGTDDSVLVIRKYDGIHARQYALNVIDYLLLAGFTYFGGIYTVDTHDLLLHDLRTPRQDARLGGRWTGLIREQALLMHAQIANCSA